MAENITISRLSLWQRIGEWLTRSASRDAVHRRRGRLLATVLIFIQASILISQLVYLRFAEQNLTPQPSGTNLPLALVASIVWLIIYIINRRGATALAGNILAAGILVLNIGMLSVFGPLSSMALGLAVPIALAGFFGTPVAALIIAVIANIAYLSLNIQSNPAYFSAPETAQTLIVHANMIFVAAIAWLSSRSTQQTLEESRALSLALTTQRMELEQRLALQTRQLQATTAVARAIAGARDMDKLLEDIVRLVRETFGYYHVQIFIIEQETSYAVLRQSTGEVGQTLLGRGHRLPVGSLSVVGQVTATGRPVIAQDTDSDFVHKRNDLLPLTRSEMAIPLIVGQQTIGALDMQSVEPRTFSEDMLATFQALADQLAVAIENARLFEQAQSNLAELREISQQVTERTWADFLSEVREDEKQQVYGPDSKGIQLHRSRVVERVLSAGAAIVSTGKDGRQPFLAAPIVVRHEVIGVIGVEPDGPRHWSQDDIALIQNIAERTALAVENARLYIQAQRSAERETLINSIAARLQRAPSLALLLETAARELADALGTENVYAEISVDQPLAHTRRQVSGEQESHESGQAAPQIDVSPPGESEEARV